MSERKKLMERLRQEQGLPPQQPKPEAPEAVLRQAEASYPQGRSPRTEAILQEAKIIPPGSDPA